ncbi:MAG: LysR substrate-binding domain-containing protein [Acidobacteriota bacterium]|nr:LysR substrate-binding domain-containing protein [Acidobacteriota bacterium]
MNTRDLKVFLAVSERLNYTRAGEDVNLSQSGVSVRVRELERELGVKLFEQLGKKIALTEAGRILEPYARRVVAAVDDARQAIEEFRGLERGRLRIGASTTPGMYIVPRIIAEFKRRYPKIEISLGIKDTRGVEEGILRNEYDFGFAGSHLTGGDDIEAIAWCVDELLLIAAPKHALTRRKAINFRDITKESFIFRERGSATQAVVENSLREAGLQLEAVIELGNPEAIKQAVQSGLGIAFISKFAVETELSAKTLIALKVKNLRIARELKIVHRKDKHLPRAAIEFIELARQSK